MKQKLIDYLLNMPRHIVWRGLFILSIAFWLLVIFGIAFSFANSSSAVRNHQIF